MFRLKFRDHLEEQEYVEIKTPFIIGFFTVLLITISGILIPYAVRYFIKDLSPQNYIIVALLPIVLLFLIFRKKFGRYIEAFLAAYMIAIVVILNTVYQDLLPQQTQNESFYTGYSFAMIIRLLGYNMISLKYAIVIYLVQIPLKFALVPTPDALQVIIALALDLVTIALSWKSEVVERGLFDMAYKMKKSVLKFKHLLTQYLPNQIAVFALDYSSAYYVNNAFKRTFRLKDINLVKGAIEKLLIESDSIEKHKILFKNLGFQNLEEEDRTINLGQFMNALSINADLLRDIGSISFPVIEEEKEEENAVLQNENSPRIKDQSKMASMTGTKVSKDAPQSSGPKKDGNAMDANDSVKYSDRGSSSKSHSSDVVYEEGRRRVFRVKIFPLMWDDTEAIAMVMDDITQQKIIMELKVADKNKDLVIAMVSHELRTPLNGLLGLLDIARKDVKQPETLSYLQACRDSGVLMLNLINSILDINQINHKKLRLVYTRFSLTNFLCEIKNLFNYSCKVKNLYLKLEIGSNIPDMMITDRNRLSQILVNLLGNAFKFTFRGGVTLGVSLESAQPLQLRFYVRDTGIGIKKEDQDKLFKMYGKLEQQDRKINTQGIGLGLTISKTLAELLGPATDGTGIKFESQVDVGTTFSFVVQSQSPETSSMREVEEGTLDELSAGVFNEENNATIMRKMTAYTNCYDNYSKIASSSQNVVYSSFSQNQLGNRRSDSPLIQVNKGEDDDQQGSRIALPSFNTNEDNIGTYSSRTNTSQQELLKPYRVSPQNGNEKRISEVAEDSDREDSMLENEVEDPIEFDQQEEKSQKPWSLVVDDNPFNLMVACHIMEERGYRVKTALNGKEAVNQFKEHELQGLTFKLTLMDCQMPVMDGYQATKVLKEMMKNGELHDCPIIALTANNRDEEHDKLCQRVGMSGHITKPLQIIELEAVLKKIQRIRK